METLSNYVPLGACQSLQKLSPGQNLLHKPTLHFAKKRWVDEFIPKNASEKTERASFTLLSFLFLATPLNDD